MIPRRTFIARCSVTDGTVVLENSLTRERVRVRSLAEIPDQIERWLEGAALPEAERSPPAQPGRVGTPEW